MSHPLRTYLSSTRMMIGSTAEACILISVLRIFYVCWIHIGISLRPVLHRAGLHRGYIFRQLHGAVRTRCRAHQGWRSERGTAVSRLARHTQVVLLADAEDLLDFGSTLDVWIVNLIRGKPLHLFLRNEAALVAESLSSKVLSTIVPHFFLSAAKLLFPQILADFYKHQGIFCQLLLKSCRLGAHRRYSTCSIRSDSWIKIILFLSLR